MFLLRQMRDELVFCYRSTIQRWDANDFTEFVECHSYKEDNCEVWKKQEILPRSPWKRRYLWKRVDGPKYPTSGPTVGTSTKPGFAL